MGNEQLSMLKLEAEQHANALHAEAIELSDWLHANPELSFHEFRAVERIGSLLAQEGFLIEQPIGNLGTAFRASFSKNGDHPHVAFLAEYDALPDLGHACGHNLITAASWAAAVAVKRTIEEHELPGKVTVLGTPGQEQSSSKKRMIDAGVFHDIDAALMIHPYSQNVLDPVCMALEEFEASFRGMSAHSAEAPHHGRNALDAVLIMFHAVDALRQHIPAGIQIHGIITEGGKSVGLIPEFAQARFACRAGNLQVLQDISRRVRKCAEAAALATDTTLEILQFEPCIDGVVHDLNLSALFRSNWELYVDEIRRGRDCTPLGALDTDNVSCAVPTIQPLVAAVPEGIVPHTPAFAEAAAKPMAHEALLIASRVLAQTGIDVLLSKP
jgi:amidohydrolase